MAQQNEKDTTRTGRDIPGGDGMVSDEDVNDVTGGKGDRKRKTGQDHSLENYEDSEPTSGVGASTLR